LSSLTAREIGSTFFDGGGGWDENISRIITMVSLLGVNDDHYFLKCQCKGLII
jgi:hypothetical protein